jgi:hypothetical protein
MNIMELCCLGCGKEGKFLKKNGKFYCAESPNSCEVKKKKDSDKKKGKPFSKNDYVRKGVAPWNKGLKNPYSPETIKKISESLKGVSKGIASTKEKEELRRKKISETMKKNPLSGGLRHGSGRGKKGWYKGYWCDSTWELAWVIYQLDNGKIPVRNKEGFKYIIDGVEKTYYPDFILDNIFYEIKGRRSFNDMDEKNKQKVSQFKHKIEILFSKDIKPMIDFVKLNYGKKLEELYD